MVDLTVQNPLKGTRFHLIGLHEHMQQSIIAVLLVHALCSRIFDLP